MITIPEFSRFCTWPDMDALEENVRSLLDMSFDRGQIAEAAASKYSKDTMCEEYIQTYLSMNGA